MHLALIVDPLEKLKPAKDSSIAIWRAAAARGHAVSAIEAGSLSLIDGRVSGLTCPLQIAPHGAPRWMETGRRHAVHSIASTW